MNMVFAMLYVKDEKNKINWSERESELRNLCDKFREMMENTIV